MRKFTLTSLAALSIVGCASLQVPPDRLAAEEASVKTAQELGAENVPAAKLYLAQARDETATAKKLAADGDERSTIMLNRASADAELAAALAREANVHNEAARADNDLRAVESRGIPQVQTPPPQNGTP